MRIDRAPDDRLDRMIADPDAYFAEARERAREMIERDLERERRRRADDKPKTFWRFGFRGWKS